MNFASNLVNLASKQGCSGAGTRRKGVPLRFSCFALK